MRRLITMTIALAVGGLASAVPTKAMAFHSPNTVQVAGVLEGGLQVQRQGYSLRKLRDLKITGWWNVPGAHVQRLEIRAPDGSLYQRQIQKFKVATTSSHVSGDPRGTPVRTVLPVSGTWITEYSLVGLWTIELYLDTVRTPVATFSFTLSP